MPPVVVSSADDARGLLASARASWIGMGRPIVLTQVALTVAEQHRWERRLNFWGLACGCHSGALLALVAIAWCVATFSDARADMAITLLNDLALVIGAALAGKLAGLAVARAMFVLDLTRLVRRLAGLRHGAA